MKKMYLVVFCMPGVCLGNTYRLPKRHIVTFEQSMAVSEPYTKEFACKDSAWSLAKRWYDLYFVKVKALSKTIRIPKKIHQIWLGSPFPEKYKQMQQTWIEHHPGWEYILWTEPDIEALNLENKKLYDAAKNYGEKSDIARFEILYRFGGLYIDTDFECLQSFEPLHYLCDFYTGIGFGPHFYVLSGLIGSIPGHPILKRAITSLKREENAYDGYNDILARSGPPFFTTCFCAEAIKYQGPCLALPITYFYPWPYYKRKSKNSRVFVRPESFAIHHWHVSWNDGKTG